MWVSMRMIRLGELSRFISGGTPKKSVEEYYTGTLPWITGADMADDQIQEPRHYITQDAVENSATNVVPAGNILLVTRTGVGKVAITNQDICISQDFTGIIPDTEKIDVKYLYRYLQNSRSYFKQRQRGATIKGVTRDVVQSLEIPVPYPDDPARSLPEQHRIVAQLESMLGEVREMRTLQEAIQTDMGYLMDAVLAEAFAEKERSLWDNEKLLGEVVQISAPLINPTRPEYRVLPHINGERIEEGTGRLLPYNTAEQDEMASSKYLFQPGNVLYSKIRPYLRKAALVNFVGVCSADMYPLHITSDDLTPEFLKWALLSRHFTEYAVELSRRARMPKLNRPQLFGYRLRYPSRSAQAKIAMHMEQVLNEVVEMKETNSHNTHALDVLGQSILAQAFRGEL